MTSVFCAHPAQTEDTLKRAWGDDWQSKVTLDESRLPIGSGCIAQVYHGHMKEASGLHDAGKEVRSKRREMREDRSDEALRTPRAKERSDVQRRQEHLPRRGSLGAVAFS